MTHVLLTRRRNPILCGELRHLNNTAAGVDSTYDAGHARDMIRRHAGKRRVILVGAHELDGAKHVGYEVLLAQDGSLRRTGRPARKEQNRRVFHLRRPWLFAGRGAVRAGARKKIICRRDRYVVIALVCVDTSAEATRTIAIRHEASRLKLV